METEFGEHLFQIRHKRKKLQKAVAYAAGLDPSYLAGLENGRREPPRREVLEKLCQVLSTTSDERKQLFSTALAARIKKVWIEASDDPALADLLVRMAVTLPILNRSEQAAIGVLISACTSHRAHPVEDDVM